MTEARSQEEGSGEYRKNEKKAHEQELWDRIGTTTGAERAETLDELSHLAFKRNE
jgi:hypothetical protein